MSRTPETKTILKTIAVFLVAYMVFLVLWIQVKNYYGYAIASIASRPTTWIKGLNLKDVTMDGDKVQVDMVLETRKFSLTVNPTLKTSNYAFNVPLTLGILTALFMFTHRRWRGYAESLTLLVLVHMLYVFSYEMKLLTEFFIQKGHESYSVTRLVFYQYLYGFTDNMVIRFEPFLIGFYMYIRFRKPQQAAKEKA